ncbi:MAG TPA: hypothetical protein VIN03_02785 [Roseateles sp.]
MVIHRVLVAALAGIALASCAQPPVAAPATSAAAEAESARLARELRTLIGPASCTADSQCRTVAVGAKACGGPSGYWAWSTDSTDAARLAELARRQSDAQRLELQAEGRISNCAVAVDPGAACIASRCQLLGAQPAAAVR